MLVMFRLYRKDDAYYDSLAATAKAAGGGDDMSDVSDADPVQLLRELVQLHPTSFRYCLIMLHISPSHCILFFYSVRLCIMRTVLSHVVSMSIHLSVHL